MAKKKRAPGREAKPTRLAASVPPPRKKRSASKSPPRLNHRPVPPGNSECPLNTDLLPHSQHIFSYFMQHLPGLAWIKDAQGRYLYANAAALEAFGRTNDDCYGRTDDDLFPPETAAQFKMNDQQALGDPAGIRRTETLQHPDGVVHHSIVAKFPLADVDGRVAYVGGIAVDITERQEAVQALRLAREQLQLVTDTMAVSVTRCSRDMKYLWVNEHYAQSLGRASADIIGRHIMEILGAELFEQLQPYFQKVLSGQRVSYEQEVHYPSLTARWIRADYSPTYGASGEPDGWVAVISDFTSRKRAELALQDSEARKGAILDASLDAIISMDSEGKIVEWNRAAEKTFGLSRDEALGREMAEVIVPRDQRPQYRGGLARYVATGVGPLIGRRTELQAQRADGTEFPIELAVARISSAGPPHFTGFVHDITERRRAEEQLLALNSQLEALVAERTLNTNRLLEEAPDGIIVVNAQGRITRINQQTELLFGYRPEELLGQPVEMLLPEGLRKRHPEHRAAYFAHPRPRAMGAGVDLVGRHQDGHEIAVEIQLTPLMLNGEHVVVASVRDVTEFNRGRDVERRLAAIMKSNLAAIVVMDTDCRILHWNRGAEQLYGYTTSEAIGKNVRMLIPPDKLEEFADSIDQLLSRGTTIVERETVRLHKDRTPIDVTLTLSLIEDGEQRPVSICAMHRDIRERKRLEHEMAELIDSERQRLGRELHDSLGQECTAIGMLVATLKPQLSQSPKQREILERLEQCAETAKKQLRLVIKGLFPVDLDADGLRVALEDLADETLRAHNVDCRLECATPIRLQDNFVATQLFLIVREAVHNAVKHANAHRILIHVEDRDGMRLLIRDDGVGISSATQESSGMGLRIMRHRCSLIGGRLQLDSPASGGTSVTIILPGGN